jgi:hypothetical protein
MATLTVYPDSGKPGTTSVDGEIGVRNDTSGNYTTVHDAATGDTLDNGGTGKMQVLNYKSGANYLIQRCIVNFDTSALTASATISAATLSVYDENDQEDNDNDALSLVTNTAAAANDYTTADYDQFGTVKQASDIDFGSLVVNSYNDMALNATGLGNISKTGVTKFGLRTANDIAASAPAAGNYKTFSTADDAGTTQDPKLVITYTLGSGGGLLLLGVGT